MGSEEQTNESIGAIRTKRRGAGRSWLSIAHIGYHGLVLSYLVPAIIVGLSAAAPIGPVNLEIMRRGLRGGFHPAFCTGLGAATVDGVYCTLFTLGFGLFAAPAVSPVLSSLGAAVLLGLGALTLREAISQDRADSRNGRGVDGQADASPGPSYVPGTGPDTVSPPAAAARPHSLRGSYGVGLAMTALNPMTLAFWVSVGAAMEGLSLVDAGERFLFAGGVVLGAMSWVVFFSLFLHHTRHRVSIRAQRLITGTGGLILMGFGVTLLW